MKLINLSWCNISEFVRQGRKERIYNAYGKFLRIRWYQSTMESHEEVAGTRRQESNYDFYAGSVRGTVLSPRHGSPIYRSFPLFFRPQTQSLWSYQPNCNIVLTVFRPFLEIRVEFSIHQDLTYFIRGIGNTLKNLIPQVIFCKVSVHLLRVCWDGSFYSWRYTDNSHTTSKQNRGSICGFGREGTDATGHRMNGSPACEMGVLSVTRGIGECERNRSQRIWDFRSADSLSSNSA